MPQTMPTEQGRQRDNTGGRVDNWVEPKVVEVEKTPSLKRLQVLCSLRPMGAPSSADWGQKIHHTQEGPLSWHREKQKINNSTSYSTYYGDVWGTMCCKKGVWIYLFMSSKFFWRNISSVLQNPIITNPNVIKNPITVTLLIFLCEPFFHYNKTVSEYVSKI